MLIVKYTKTGSACYVSHVDTLRTVNRTFSRANVNVDYSEGFNPHMLVFFSPPNAVGVESLCEYFAVATKDSDDFVNKFNKNAPQGFVAQKMWIADKNPNLAKEITEAQYQISGFNIGLAGVDRILSMEQFNISFEDKNGAKTKDYKNFVLSAQNVNDDTIIVKLKYGNENLRPDRFIQGLVQNFGLPDKDYKIVKTKVFANGKDTDDFMDDFVK